MSSFPSEVKENAVKLLQATYQSSVTTADLTLLVDATEFKVHKCLLMAASQYFAVMFSGSFAEASQEAVRIGGLSARTMDIILKSLYGFETDLGLLEPAVLVELLKGVNLLQINWFERCCWRSLLDGMTTENCWLTLDLAEALTTEWAYQEVLAYIGAHFESCRSAPELLAAANPNVIEAVLASDGLRIDSEMEVFECLVKWLNYGLAQRIKLCGPFLLHIRLAAVPVALIRDQIQPLCLDEHSSEYVTRAIEWHGRSYDEKILNASNLNLVPRKTLTNKIAVVCSCDQAIKIHTYCPMAQAWTMDVVNVRNVSFEPVCMGFRNKDSLIVMADKVYQIGLKSCRVETLSEMAHRSEYGLLIDAHCLYIIGGLRADVAVRNVQMFSFKTRDWSNLPSMRTPRQGAGAVMHKGRIYVFSGGTESAQPLQYSECYDPGSNAWTALPPMPVGCFKPAVISHGDHIFLFGGYMSLDDSRCCCRVQRFDTLTNEWTVNDSVADLRSLAHLSVACHEERLYIMGFSRKKGTIFGEYLPNKALFRKIVSDQGSPVLCGGQIFSTAE